MTGAELRQGRVTIRCGDAAGASMTPKRRSDPLAVFTGGLTDDRPQSIVTSR